MIKRLLLSVGVFLGIGLVANAQYCTPLFGSGCSLGDQIEVFTTSGGATNISTNLSSGCSTGAYIYHSTATVSQVQGQSINFVVQAGSAYAQGHRIWVDWNNDQDFTDAGEDMWNSVTWTSTPFNGSFTVPLGATPGLKRMRVRCNFVALPTDPCALQSYGEVEDFNFQVLSLGPCLATPFVGPTLSTKAITCAGETFSLSIDTMTFGSGQHYQWQKSPDNITYTNMVNDTNIALTTSQNSTNYYRLRVICGTGTPVYSTPVLVTTTAVALPAGTYTINGALSTGGTNFNSFADFKQAVVCGGIAGPVTVNVIAKGSAYAEQIEFGAIGGTSATSKITINGNGQTITSSGGTIYPTLRFNGAKHMVIKNLKIEATGTTNNWGVHVTGASEYLTFDSITVTMNTTVTTSSVSGFVINGSTTSTSPTATGPSGKFITLKNSTIEGGYYGITLVGPTGAPYTNGNVIKNNVVKDWYFYGIYAGYQDSATFEGNDINRDNRSGTLSSFYGLYYLGNATDVVITRNKIHGPATLNPTAIVSAYPIFLSSANATAADPCYVTNNVIYDLKSNGTIYALYFSSGAFVNFYHNTVAIENLTATTSSSIIRAFVSFSSTAGAVNIKNNVFSINHVGMGTKHLIYISSSTPTWSINNNHYNIANSSAANQFGFWLSTNVASFAAWKNVNSAAFDQNSVYGDPIYDITTYTPQSPLGNNAGTNLLSEVPVDLNGVARTATPDIGAVQFTPLSCLQPNILGGTSTPTTATINWLNDVDADSVRIEYGPAGFVQGTGVAGFYTGSTATFTGLASQTCYDFYIKTYCNGSAGNGQAYYTLCTKCAAKATPLIENFDAKTASNSITNPGMPDCWSYYRDPSHTGYGYTYSFLTPKSAPNHFRFYSGGTLNDTLCIISPAIQGLTAGNKRIKLWGLSGSTSYNQRIIIGTVASPEQMNTLDIIDTVVVPNAYTEHTVYLDVANGYNGTHEYVVIMQGAYLTFQSLYVDDILIEQVPSCNPPTSISAANITATGAQIAWTTIAGTSFALEYGPQGFIQGTGIGTLVNPVTTPHTLSGLTPNTFYDVYVRDNCNPTAWAGPFTFKTNCLAALNGTYTVGGTAGPNNFATLDSAISVLTGCGISGPVTFNFQGAARKNLGGKTINAIQGASATNTVTFNGRGVALDTIRFSAGSQFGFAMNGTKYMKFQNMTINGSLTERTIWLSNNAEYITFENTHIWNSPTTTAFNTGAIIASASLTSPSTSGNNCNNITVKNSKIVGGYYGISIYGLSTSAYLNNFLLENIEFVDQYYYGLYMYYSGGISIINNVMNGVRNTFGYGMYGYAVNINAFTKSKFFAPTYGIYLSQLNTYLSPTATTDFSNNFAGGGTYGVYLSGFNQLNMYHNSVRGGTSGFYAFTPGTTVNMRNNIFVGGSSYAWYCGTNVSSLVLDYNIYHNTSGSVAYNGAAYTTLAAWKTAQPLLNANSLAGDPGFLSNSDFHIVGTLPNGVGLNGLATVDIDGDTRPATGSTIVDIGADEFTPLNWDASLEGVLVATAGCGNAATPMQVIVKNFGLNTITSLPISVAITGGITATVNTTATVNIPQGGTDTVAAGTFNSYNGAQGVNFNVTLALVGDQKASNNTMTKGPGNYVPFEPQTSGMVDTVCATGDSVDLYAMYIPGTNYAWYNVATGGVKIANGDTISVPSNGQTTYYVEYDSASANPQVGTGTLVSTSTNITPYKTFYMDGRAQYLVLASELAALGVVGGGQITSLAFDVAVPAAQTMNNFEIKMGGTQVASMTSIFQPNTGMTVVYNGNYTTTAGWNVHNFTTPFVWNGADNILVEVCFDNNSWTSNSTVRYSVTPFNSVTDGFADLNTTSGCTPGQITNQIGNGNRPNMKFNMSTIACSNIRKPVSFAVNTDTAVAAYSFTVQPNGADVNFNASASNGDLFYWTFGDGGTATGATTSHTYTAGGTYTVCLAVADSTCGTFDTICQQVLVTVGIEEGLIGQSINLYPNPNSGKFRVEFQVEGVKNVELRVVSLLGQLVYANKPGNVSGTYREEIDLSNEAAGVYMLQVITDEGTITRKVTVRK